MYLNDIAGSFDYFPKSEPALPKSAMFTRVAISNSVGKYGGCTLENK